MTKIDVLEATVYNLENSIYKYGWHSSNTCNCGILAQTIMNGDSIFPDGGLHEAAEQMYLDPEPGAGISHFMNNVTEKCLSTGYPLPRILKALCDYDFTRDELTALEWFSSGRGNAEAKRIVGSKINFEGMHKERKSDVITYIKAWIEVLKEKEVQENVPVAEEMKEFSNRKNLMYV